MNSKLCCCAVSNLSAQLNAVIASVGKLWCPGDADYYVDFFAADEPIPCLMLKKREGVPEMSTKPLKALRGYQASKKNI